MKRPTLRTLIVGLSATLFVVSLTQVGFYTAGQNAADGASPSILLLLIGWMGLADHKIAWYANPALFAGWRTTQRLGTRPTSLFYPLLALSLSLTFLMHNEIMVNEAGGTASIVGYGAGYWLWVSSSGLLVLGNVLLLFYARKQSSTRGTPGGSVRP